LSKKPLKNRSINVQGKLSQLLNSWSSKKPLKYTLYLSAIIIFFALILIPPVIGIFTRAGSIQNVINQPEIVNQALVAIYNSFIIALIVSAIDLVAGIPLAWIITRGKSRWLSVLDTMADIPFIVPTAALGYSLLLFWSQSGGISALFGHSLVSPGWLLVMLLHFTFSFPVVVRVIVGSLLDYKMEFYDAFLEYARELKGQGRKLVICGDVNTAHKEIDLARPKENETISGFLPEERAWIDKFLSQGYVDTFRSMHPEPGQYTWWSVRSGARARNVGWRIDYFYASENAMENIRDSFIMPEVPGSDHCPLGIVMEL